MSASFATTRWSLVVRAASQETTQARDALSRLCQTYWYPLYSFVRRRGYSAEDARDLTILFVSFCTIAFIPGLGSALCLADAVVFALYYQGIVFNANLSLNPGGKNRIELKISRAIPDR
jgi:hypothetical protein